MPPVYVIKMKPDGTKLMALNLMEETDVPETVDSSSTSSDYTSAKAEENAEKLRKEIVKSSNVLFPSSTDGEGAESGESEVVANSGIRSGKTTSALEVDGDSSKLLLVNIMKEIEVLQATDDKWKNIVRDVLSTSSDIDTSASAEEKTEKLRKDIVKLRNVLFPTKIDAEGVENEESESVANTGIRSGKVMSALEDDGDGSEKFMVNLMEDTDVSETVDDVCTSSDFDISANAEENTGNLRMDMVKSSNVLFPSSTDGEGAENGESEAVANTGIRSGKTTSALEVDGSEYIPVNVNLMKIPDVMESVDDVWKNIVRDSLSTSFDIDTSANAVKSTYTGKPRNDKVKLNLNVLFPSSSDGEGAKNGEAVANIGIRSGKTTSAIEVKGDGSELCLENVEDTDVPETVDDVWANIVRDASVTSSGSDTSANAVENTGKLRKNKPNLIVNVAFPSSSDGEGAENGESEAVANTGIGSGKMTSVLKPSPSVGMSLENFLDSPIGGTGKNGGGENGSAASMMEEAWEQLSRSYVSFKGQRVGTIAAIDDSGSDTLNYNQVFVRDFVPFGLACLMKADADVDIVKNFLLKTLHLQGWEKRIDNFTLGEGVMPASFKVIHDPIRQKEVLQADFGGSAIGRVAPVDSGFWWIILLRSYTKCTHDYSLSELPEVQRGIKLILNLCLSDGFDTFPTLLCADGCSMIDRRMGVYGYPIEIQALFFFALRCARQLLKPEHDGKELIERIDKRITALSYHIQNYYWLDFTQLNNIYRYKTEEYSHTAVNKFNVIPESIPDWVFEFMPLRGGYFIGNVSPARMDFRWFLLGNCIAILSSLATPAQATAVMDLIEERWADLIGEMPLKITYPALEGHEWKIVTGCDPKNTRWSYHNGGSWPVLLWLLTAASIKTGRPQIAKRAIELVEQRLSKDGWPEYYDGITGRYIGKQARKYQTWSIAGYLVSKLMIENPSNLLIISLEEDKKIAKPRLTRSASWTY